MQRVCRKQYRNLSIRQKYSRLSQHKSANEFRLSNQQSLINSVNLNNVIKEHDHLIASCREQQISARNEIAAEQFILETEQSSSQPDLNAFNVCGNGCSVDSGSKDNDSHKDTLNDSEFLADNPTNFEALLQQACLDANLNHVQINTLLRVLRTHKCHRTLPKDSRTLLKTPNKKINLLPVGNGVYWHIGFIHSLTKHLTMYNNIPATLKIQLSTDGLSLSRTNPHTFWPIQYRVINIPNFKPLIAGIYMGLEKPKDPFEFFQNFINEVEEARRLGGVPLNNQRITFEFTNFVADAPARALILNHFSHNSSEPCSKCKVTGSTFENRVMVYLGVNHEKRTDEEYMAGIYEDHQKGGSPLSDLLIPPVTKVPFDIMHLVYLGVTVRLLDAWFKGKFGFPAKLSNNLISEASSRFMDLKDTCPIEFARRPQPLTKYGKFKATELRHFLLYASPIVLYKILPDDYYYHFLNLHVAMRILTSSNHSQKRLKIAEMCLNLFIEFAPQLYTPAFMSYNIHALQHLVDDAREFGSLENCAAFIYENNMPLFKKNIRNHPLPLQQFANRLEEKNYIQHTVKTDKIERVSNLHVNGFVANDVEMINYKEYKKYESNKFTIKLDNINCFAALEDDTICKIENILATEDNIFAVIRKYNYVKNLYKQPIKSTIVGEYKCSGLSNTLSTITMSSVVKKCYSLSTSFLCNAEADERVISVLLHTY